MANIGRQSDASATRSLEGELADETLKRMIYFTKREAEKDGRTFCAYLLDLAMNALDEDSDDINLTLRAKLTPIGDKAAAEQVV